MAIALYIHIPFCVKKCRYCDFTSYPFQSGAAKAYLNALLQEISLYGGLLSDEERKLTSLYIGGGTPTCLPIAGLKSILENVRSVFHLLPGCEVTVEANPGTIGPYGFRELAGTGVNRLSLGVQSFQDSQLGLLGRIHNAGEAVGAVQQAREAGFSNLNMDFIFGVPEQTLKDWRETLNMVMELAPEHISVYGLQLEEGTPLERAVARGELEACPEELELSMYRTAIDFLKERGYIHYEISNFAKTDRQSVHNLRYWLNRPYLGLGPAAHSYFRGERFSNEISLEKYVTKLTRRVFPVEARETISVEKEMSETMFLGLRLIGGIELDRFYRRFGCRVEDVYREEVARLLKAGLVESTGGYLRLTKRGLPVANRVFGEFV